MAGNTERWLAPALSAAAVPAHPASVACHVTYGGETQIIRAAATTQPLTVAPVAIGSYFLFPANLWPHKNHERLLRAFETYRRATGRNDAMVFTGHPEGWERLAPKFGHLPVHHLGFVGDNNLRLPARSG